MFEVFESEKLRTNQLEVATDFNRQTLYNHLYGYSNTKEATIRICVALGLDLVMTMIFLMSKGFILNPITNEKDRKTMQFIYNNKEKGYMRTLEYLKIVE